MKFSEEILYRLAKSWPSPVKETQARLGEDPSSERYLLNYALLFQYDYKVRTGLGIDVRGKRVLEIGCGHGGITWFTGINGASRAVGIDINVRNLEIAHKLKDVLSWREKDGCAIEFYEMNATELNFESENFDIIMADNVFEHFMEPEKVLKECYRVLSRGGIVVIGGMPSYYSKYGLHLKNGLKLPWANLLFSERTICNVMVRLCKEDTTLSEIYPGVKNNPEKIRDLRAYRDLNGMTYNNLKKLARKSGFAVTDFRVSSTPRIIGSIAQRLPIISSTVLVDIFSNKASCILKKK